MKRIFLFLSFISLLSFSLQKESTKITFEGLLSQVHGLKMKTIAVAGAEGDEVLKSIRAAKDRQIANSILFGDAEKIKATAKELNMDISDFDLVDTKGEKETARAAVKYVHDGKADMYMKGTINTKDILKAVLDKEIGLRTGKPLSVVAVFEVEGVHKMLFLTDPAVIPYPTFEEKISIIDNALEVAQACGIAVPKVAPLAAVEVINPKMPETVEAGKLTEMNNKGEIKNCIIDGPLSMDLAIDPVAAKHKGATGRKIVGDADILLFPDIHGANFAYKLLTHVAKSENGNILTGTSAPVILTSRSDTFESKLNSIILASVYAEHLKNKKNLK